MKKKGFLLLEILLACALFVAVIPTLGMLLYSVESFLLWSNKRIGELRDADLKLEKAMLLLENNFDEQNFPSGVKIVSIDNFTKKVEVFAGSTKFFGLVTDTRESEGQSSCRPYQDKILWQNPVITTFDVGSIGVSMEPTDIDVVGSYVYVTSNTAAASSPDFFIFDIAQTSAVKLISALDTGPGINALHVAEDYAYAANSSINAQLQIIDITEKEKPRLLSSYKLPGVYGSSTPIGTSIFYKKEKVFLGTDKSDIGELYYINVASPTHPESIDSEEISHGVNDIFAFRDKMYVASPHKDEMKSFSISPSGNVTPFSSYNDPGATGNGKQVWLYLDKLLLGKTKTFDREELIELLATSSPSVDFRISFGTSVHGVIGYGDLIFTILNRVTDGFIIFFEKERLNSLSINFSSPPINFDCDQNIFVVVSEKSSILTFVTYSSPQ